MVGNNNLCPSASISSVFEDLVATNGSVSSLFKSMSSEPSSSELQLWKLEVEALLTTLTSQLSRFRNWVRFPTAAGALKKVIWYIKIDELFGLNIIV